MITLTGRTYRMSVSMTKDAVYTRVKTATRRREDTWGYLQPGDVLVLIEKGQGLRKGEHQVEICKVVVVDVRVEPLSAIHNELAATRREGLGHLTPDEFVIFWLRSHGYPTEHANTAALRPDPDVRRIEWEYL